MAIRLSKGLRNFLLEGGSLKQAFANGKLQLYSGSQPSSADAAVTGTLLTTYTDAAGAHTNEVSAKGVVTLSVGAVSSDTVTTFTVNSLEIMGSTTAFNTSLTQTASDICDKINDNPKNFLFKASNEGAVITITAKPGLGTLYNGKAISVGVGGNMVAAVTSTSFGSGTGGGTAGVDAVNGLKFGDSEAGTLVKHPDQDWEGVSVDSGTVGWFRLLGSVADAGALDEDEVYIRLDGNVATSGANLNLSSTTHTEGATQTLTTFSPSEPAS